MTSQDLPNFCNRCQSYYDTPHCDCYTKTNPNKQKLKLYKVTIHIVGKKGGTHGVPFGYRTYILDSNEVDAEARVIELVGADKISSNHIPTVEELKGPFSKGQILFWDEF